MNIGNSEPIKISVKHGMIIEENNGTRFCPRVELGLDAIRVGCTVITPEAAKFIFDKWRENFGHAPVVVVQPYSRLPDESGAKP